MSRSGAHPLPLAHRLMAVLCIVLLGVYVVRAATVGALATATPERAATLWSGHPEVKSQLGLVAIASATAARQPVPDSAFAALRSAGARAPLASEPFLVRGVQAQTAGQAALARAAFLAAERRDPRSLPARYFLAEQDLRSGNAAHGIAEIGVLARLAPQGGSNVAPFLATLAQDPKNWPAVRTLLRGNPALAEVTLGALAADARNAKTVVALADPATIGPDAPWAPALLQSIVAAGDYSSARQLWARLSRVELGPATLLFDAGFRNPRPPAPFNWTLTSSSVGLAERRPGGQLHAIFYGQQDGPLARQLLVLSPGSYRLTARVAGDEVRLRVLGWSITCAKGTEPFAQTALAPGSQSWSFTVPSGCPAQWLELSGASTDIPQQADATISNLQLQRVGNGG